MSGPPGSEKATGSDNPVADVKTSSTAEQTAHTTPRRVNLVVKPIRKRGVAWESVIAAAAQLPPRCHWVGKHEGAPFDGSHSLVVKWLTSHPAIRQWLFEVLRQRGVILYDQEKRTWRGRDHKSVSNEQNKTTQ